MSNWYDPKNLTLGILGQKEGVQSLIDNARLRLELEKERKKIIKQEISSGRKKAKDRLEFTLDTISDQIGEIRKGIKQRKSFAKKVDKKQQSLQKSSQNTIQ